MSLLRLSTAVVIALSLGVVSGSAQADTLLIEIASARAMQAHQHANGRLALDPLFTAAGHAPGESLGLRPSGRTDAIARAIGAVVRRYSEVFSCAPGSRCRLSGVAAHLMLSDPSIAGDTATVTATVRQNSSGSRQPQYY